MTADVTGVVSVLEKMKVPYEIRERNGLFRGKRCRQFAVYADRAELERAGMDLCMTADDRDVNERRRLCK